MARGYSRSWQKAAGREDSFRYPQRRRNCSSLNDQCLAEKAIRIEKGLGVIGTLALTLTPQELQTLDAAHPPPGR
jgi:hypothetical protein